MIENRDRPSNERAIGATPFSSGAWDLDRQLRSGDPATASDVDADRGRAVAVDAVVEGVANTARYSMSAPGRWESTYVPEAEPAGIVPTTTHAVAPTARRWRVTVRPDTALPLSRPYEAEATTLSVAVRVVALIPRRPGSARPRSSRLSTCPDRSRTSGREGDVVDDLQPCDIARPELVRVPARGRLGPRVGLDDGVAVVRIAGEVVMVAETFDMAELVERDRFGGVAAVRGASYASHHFIVPQSKTWPCSRNHIVKSPGRHA